MMDTTLARKGQVTIPKRIRETLGLGPGSRVDECGRIVIQKAQESETSGAEEPVADRFARVRGHASVKWTTDELMRLLH